MKREHVIAGIGAATVALVGAAAAYAQGPAAAQTPGEIAQDLCANNGALLTQIIAWVGGTVAASAVLSNSKTLASLPVIGPILNVVGANWASWLRAAAAKAAEETTKKVPALAALIFSAGLLAACAQSTTPGAAAPDPIAQIAQFSLSDLQAADAEAVVANDVLGHACYPALTQFIQSLPSAPAGTTVTGAFALFEAARITRIQVEGAVGGGVPNYLKLGCGGLLSDERLFLIRLGAIGAAGAATGGLVP